MSYTGKLEVEHFGGISLKDIELSLQKRFYDDSLKVINFKATNLLPPGENFSGCLVKLDVVIVKKDNEKEEILHMVVKTNNSKEKLRIFEWQSIFERELFVYTELFPAFRDLERQAGIEESNLLPTYLGHRDSSENGNDELVSNSYFLMENMITKDYYLANRHDGLDFEHASLALKYLAKYHALGISLKYKNPIIHKKAVQYNEVFGFDPKFVSKVYMKEIDIFRQIPQLTKHLKVIENSYKEYSSMARYASMPKEPWATIIHGDFWTNNILFHKDKDTKKLDDIKFIDFQFFIYSSPLRDLPYFICASLSNETVEDCLDDLLNIYFENFIESLKLLGCDISPFTRLAFDIELKKQAIDHLPRNALANKFFSFQIEEGKDNKEIIKNVLNQQWNEVYVERIARMIDIYERKGWF